MEIHQGAGWAWYQFMNESKEEGKKLIEQFHMPKCRHWFEMIDSNKRNILHIDTTVKNNEAIYGSFLYAQNFHDEDDQTVFHFYLTRTHLFTVDLDMSIFEGVDHNRVEEQVRNAQDPIEAFLILLGEMLKGYLEGVDHLELQLQKLKWQVHADNNKSIIELVIVLRHEILIWKSLIMSIKKIQMAVEETFLVESSQKEAFQRTRMRVNRGYFFVNEIEEELDSLMHSEEVLTSHRGNEIVKALTIFTAIFTPVTSLGAVWGMNFEVMPELSLKYGYLFALLLIFLSTALVYVYLVKKGWTGDILKDNKRRFLKRRRQEE
jgi:Mg2+ and Co2+ transporter CorA